MKEIINAGVNEAVNAPFIYLWRYNPYKKVLQFRDFKIY